jgi:mannose-6-phosphate isomerase
MVLTESSEAIERAIREKIFVSRRPWGNFRQFTLNEPTTVKVITVEAGQQLSLQTHELRDELWIVLDDGIRVQVGDDVIDAAVGDEFVIPRRTKHRISSRGPTARILEVAFGKFDEDDIVRLEDIYSRVP